MNKVAYIIGSTFVAVNCNGQAYSINKSDSRFEKVLAILKSKKYDKLEEALSIPKAIALFSSGNIKVFNGSVLYKNNEVNNVITKKIFEYIENDYPYEPLALFLGKIMENPSINSRNQLYTFLEKYNLPITDDGDFIVQKAVSANFKDFQTGKKDNRVGQIVKEDRSKISDNPSSACSFGLHVGAPGYINQYFESQNPKVLLVKVNPKNVCSVPSDCNAQKIRVCEYKVIGVVGEKAEAFESSYAPANEKHVKKSNTKKQVSNKAPVGADRAYSILMEDGAVYYYNSAKRKVLLNAYSEPSRQYLRNLKAQFYKA